MKLDWWSCKDDLDFHSMVSEDRTRCGKTVEVEEYQGSAYIGLRCEMCKGLIARDPRPLAAASDQASQQLQEGAR